MRIELSAAGDGTNTFVELLEDLGGYHSRVKSFFTASHGMSIAGTDPRCHEARRLYDSLYSIAPPPVISGEFSHLHPYWKDHPEQLAKLSNSASLSDI